MADNPSDAAPRRYMVDTSVVARRFEPTHPHHKSAMKVMRDLTKAGNELCITRQVLYEFWVMATRPPSSRGLGLTHATARRALAQLESLYTVLDDMPETYDRWKHLIFAYSVSGKTAHDAHVCATMFSHGVLDVVTLNAPDFRRFSKGENLQLIVPSETTDTESN